MIKNNQTMYNHINGLCNALSSVSININKDFKKNKIKLSVKKRKYINYLYNFLTSKKISKIKNSEILKKLIY